MNTSKRKPTAKILIIVGLVILAGVSFTLRKMHDRNFPEALRGLAVDPKPIGQVSLVDKTGNTLSDQHFKGRWTLVFFGYTNCPDVCPTTLLELEQLKKSFAKDPVKRKYQFLFVTVDPQRDTTKRLNEYVSYFDNDFQAAGGDIAQIKTFEHVFGAFHKYAKKNKDDMHYSVAHSAEVYIVDPDQQYVGKFLPPFDVNKLSHQLTALSNYVQKKGDNA